MKRWLQPLVEGRFEWHPVNAIRTVRYPRSGLHPFRLRQIAQTVQGRSEKESSHCEGKPARESEHVRMEEPSEPLLDHRDLQAERFREDSLIHLAFEEPELAF